MIEHAVESPRDRESADDDTDHAYLAPLFVGPAGENLDRYCDFLEAMIAEELRSG